MPGHDVQLPAWIDGLTTAIRSWTTSRQAGSEDQPTAGHAGDGAELGGAGSVKGKGDIDKIWDRAGFAAEAAYREMNEFLRQCEKEGPSRSFEELVRRRARFLEIQKRCNDRCLEIFERASSGEPAPHLTVIKRGDE